MDRSAAVLCPGTEDLSANVIRIPYQLPIRCYHRLETSESTISYGHLPEAERPKSNNMRSLSDFPVTQLYSVEQSSACRRVTIFTSQSLVSVPAS